MNFLEAWDLGGSYAMNLLHHDWLTHVFHFITALGNSDVLLLVTTLSVLFFIFIDRWRTACCLLATVLLGYGIEQSVKPWVNRPRPELSWVEPQDKTKSPSFPSGHALLGMAVYGGLALSLAAALEDRRVKGLVVAAGGVLVLLVGFSRMYLGVHYMSDVVAGFCAGLGCVLLFRWIDRTWTAAAHSRIANTSTAAPIQP